MLRKERYEKILAWFETHHPKAETELFYASPFELLVAVILSAQCTDKRVNMVTPHLFAKYPDANSLASASVEDIFSLIKSISYPNNKAKHLQAMAQKLISNFNSEVPDTVENLITLPGVGRKTANVIASVVFNKPAMAVDTHVFRVSARLGLTINARTPLAAEKQLVKYIPEHKIHIAHHWLILHGRYICLARKPKCEKCEIQFYCKYFEARLRKATSKLPK
ncbi:MAG: endonuclease III [Bacteroidetes bacterium]|nr:endonuclease III [Bacteroidota bacterium]